MNKYRIYFNEKGKIRYKKAIEVVFGYSEEDALLRYNIEKWLVESINQIYL